ncbi:MAG: DNA primase [Methanoculleus sp.]|nr:DNA primase [Methanoculleus sp.]
MSPYSALLEDACRFYEQHLTDEHRQHLRTRYGLESWFTERMRIGYAPAGGADLLTHFMDRGYTPDQIIGSGLVVRWTSKDGTRSGATDLFRGRIVFPYLDEDLAPAYFIGRQTDESPGTHPAKYIKQRVDPDGGPREPIFGIWSVRPGDPLIITEGITDALIVLQSGNPCISPVTTAFKREKAPEVAECVRRSGGPIYILNDNEESGAGDAGAARIGYACSTQRLDGARVYIGRPPRPPGVEKVDLNDFLRSGGDLETVIAAAMPAEDHPAIQAEHKRVIEQAAATLRSIQNRKRYGDRRQSERKAAGRIDLDELRTKMPALSAYTGIAPGERGSHPIYGSIHGDNFVISGDGETWTSFHGGNEPGKSGNIFKLIALEQGLLSDERDTLRGDEFIQTIKYCQERWG